MSIIYKFTDIETGDIYIGQTGRDINIRSKEHFNLLKKNKHHNDALQKIFNDNPNRLAFAVICKAPSFRIHELEQEYIREIRGMGKK